MNLIDNIPIKNIFAKPVRSFSLVFFAAFLTIASFGGTLIVSSLRHGLESLEKRLGADIVVVPLEVRQTKSMEDILLNGNRSKTYMERKSIDELLKIEGVEKVSPQFYLSSLSASCCSVEMQIVGFEPDSDFTVQSWVRESYNDDLKDGEILIGSKVELPKNRTLTFYGDDYKIASQLHETGSGLDNAVYANFDTIKKLLLGYSKIDPNMKINVDDQVSSLMVKVQDGCSVEQVKTRINSNFKNIKAVSARSLTTDVADSLSKMSKIVGILIFAVWVLCLFVITIVFSMIINERKKEFAVLRVSGVSQKKLSALILKESVLLNVFGGICGVFLVLLILIPFNTLIEQSLKMPYLMPSSIFILTASILSVLISALIGAIVSSIKAFQISKQDTSLILREN